MKWMRNMRSSIVVSACALALADACADAGYLRCKIKAEVASAYHSTSSGLRDTRPVAMQTFNWNLSLGEFGFFEGFAWAISSLHDMQRERHRALFYNAETSVKYGYRIPVADGVGLTTGAGPYFAFPFGYRNASLKCWGPSVVQRLDNPWAVPYWSGLWIVERTRRARVCVGLEKKFALSESFSVAPFAELIWMDERRFSRRYGETAGSSDVCGWSLSHTYIGVKTRWEFGRNLSMIATAAMSDVVDPRGRRAVRRSDAYWAKTDWPIVRIGVEYSF
jgi:hypothetical protein